MLSGVTLGRLTWFLILTVTLFLTIAWHNCINHFQLFSEESCFFLFFCFFLILWISIDSVKPLVFISLFTIFHLAIYPQMLFGPFKSPPFPQKWSSLRLPPEVQHPLKLLFDPPVYRVERYLISDLCTVFPHARWYALIHNVILSVSHRHRFLTNVLSWAVCIWLFMVCRIGADGTECFPTYVCKNSLEDTLSLNFAIELSRIWVLFSLLDDLGFGLQFVHQPLS